ncbi:MAG: LysR substrate-binding domain-containing protein [Candidatus Methylacidiphilales bacterium]
MELRHLRYFVAVAEQLSFTKAAARLRIAQPSLTRQIRDLEEEIGVELFLRARNRITLTEPGRRFLEDSKNLLAVAASNVAAVRKIKRSRECELRIGYVSSMHFGLLRESIAAFRKQHANVQLSLFDMSCSQQWEALQEKKIDVGFIGPRPRRLAPQLCVECATYDTMVVAHSSVHSFSNADTLKLKDLASQFLIGMSDSCQPGAREWLMATCAEAGFEARIILEAEEELSAMKSVAAGIGVALLPAQLMDARINGVTFSPLTPPLCRESTLAWRSENCPIHLQSYVRIVKEHLSLSPLSGHD